MLIKWLRTENREDRKRCDEALCTFSAVVSVYLDDFVFVWRRLGIPQGIWLLPRGRWHAFCRNFNCICFSQCAFQATQIMLTSGLWNATIVIQDWSQLISLCGRSVVNFFFLILLFPELVEIIMLANDITSMMIKNLCLSYMQFPGILWLIPEKLWSEGVEDRHLWAFMFGKFLFQSKRSWTCKRLWRGGGGGKGWVVIEQSRRNLGQLSEATFANCCDVAKM